MIFQAFHDQGILPHIWKSGAIVPVYKKGSRTECGNDISYLYMFQDP